LASSLFRPRRFALLRAAGFLFGAMAALWRPHGGVYELATAGLHGRLRLDSAPPCLTACQVAGWQHRPDTSDTVLALDTLAYLADGAVRLHPVARSGSTCEHVQRQQAVTATFPASSDCPVRLTGHWHAGTVKPGGGNEEHAVRPVVDLHVEAQTDRSLCAFECLTATALEAEQVLLFFGWPAAQEWIDLGQWLSPRVHRIVLPRDAQAARLSYDGRTPKLESTWTGPIGPVPLVVWRLTGGEISYAEMCHVQDGARLILQSNDDRGAAGGRSIQTSFGLFEQDLEKGVVLRARLRGVWLERRRDLESADRLLRLFLDEPPPLAT
jgi:hypothetical protein